MAEKIVLNKTKLARNYGLNRETVIRYAKKCIKDEKNISKKEYDALLDMCTKLKQSKENKQNFEKQIQNLKSDVQIEFSDDKSSISELLAQERTDYNYFLKCLEVDKKKVEMANSLEWDNGNSKDTALIISTYKKELREDKKTLLNIGARINEYEEKLALVGEEDNPFD